MVKTRKRRTRLSKRHLAVAISVDDIVVHCVFHLDDTDSVHHVIFPIFPCAGYGLKLPLALVGRICASPMPLAHLKLALVSAAVLEALNSLAMWHVVLPWAMIQREPPFPWVEEVPVRRALYETLHEVMVHLRILRIQCADALALAIW